MRSRLKIYQRLARRFLNPTEVIVAAAHGHESRLLMALPEVAHFFFGRMVVVTNERIILFGPGFRTVVDQSRLGSGAVGRDGSRVSFTATDGTEQILFNVMGRRRQVKRVMQATTR